MKVDGFSSGLYLTPSTGVEAKIGKLSGDFLIPPIVGVPALSRVGTVCLPAGPPAGNGGNLQATVGVDDEDIEAGAEATVTTDGVVIGAESEVGLIPRAGVDGAGL